jgi:hypothetical protein
LKKTPPRRGKPTPADINVRQSTRLKSLVDQYVAVPARWPVDYAN